MNADEKSRYFQELTRNLQHEGLTVKPETEDGLLPVEMEEQRLCQAAETSAVRYWKEDVSGDIRHEALNRVTDIARTTAGYMSQLEAAPQLTASVMLIVSGENLVCLCPGVFNTGNFHFSGPPRTFRQCDV